MEEKLRQKDTVIEKLRLKNMTTKAYITKMEHQLAHKEEMGEVLHLVSRGARCGGARCRAGRGGRGEWGLAALLGCGALQHNGSECGGGLMECGPG